jgi:hypothetical protein
MPWGELAGIAVPRESEGFRCGLRPAMGDHRGVALMVRALYAVA